MVDLSRSYAFQDGVLEWLHAATSLVVVSQCGTESLKHACFCCVPHSSVFDPLLFIMYSTDLAKFACLTRVNLHFNVNDSDTQMYRPISHLDPTSPSNIRVNFFNVWSRSNCGWRPTD